MTMIMQEFNVHKKTEELLENKDFDTINYLVELYSYNDHEDKLMNVFEVLNVTVKEMKTKSEVKTLYPVILPSINTLMDRNKRDVAEHFFAPGKGVIAREIEMKAVC